MQQEIFPDSKVCWAPEHFPKASSRTGISIPWLICQGHINTKSMVWRTCSHKGRDRTATLFSAFAFVESKVPLTEHKDEIWGKRESQKSQKKARKVRVVPKPLQLPPWSHPEQVSLVLVSPLRIVHKNKYEGTDFHLPSTGVTSVRSNFTEMLEWC